MGASDAPEASAASKSYVQGVLPLALFMVTFGLVMGTLLVYIDNTDVGQRHFRQMMRRDDELANVSQDDEQLVELMAQRILVSASLPFPPYRVDAHHRAEQRSTTPTPSEAFVAHALQQKRNGVFVELGAYSLGAGGGSRTEWLEAHLQWGGIVVTPDAKDYFRLRATRTAKDTYAAQACLSANAHPKEVTYQDNNDVNIVGFLGEDFSARVKCFPLYTFLLATRQKRIDFLTVSATNGYQLSAFNYLPRSDVGKVQVSIIEIVDNGRETRGLEQLLHSKGFKLAKRLPDSTIYTAHDIPLLKI